jgi:hypothetical protein
MDDKYDDDMQKRVHDGEQLPLGFHLWVRCLRTVTGSELVLKVPRDIYRGSDLGDWCVDSVPLGWHPHSAAVLADDQAECLEFE